MRFRERLFVKYIPFPPGDGTFYMVILWGMSISFLGLLEFAVLFQLVSAPGKLVWAVAD